MSEDTLSKQTELLMKKMVHYVTVALIIFSVAWFCLTAGIFTVNPVGPIGIFFLCVGLLCAAISIFYFVRYALISNKIREISQNS